MISTCFPCRRGIEQREFFLEFGDQFLDLAIFRSEAAKIFDPLIKLCFQLFSKFKEARPCCGELRSLSLNCLACSTVVRLVEGSLGLKSTGTLALLIRWTSDSR